MPFTIPISPMNKEVSRVCSIENHGGWRWRSRWWRPWTQGTSYWAEMRQRPLTCFWNRATQRYILHRLTYMEMLSRRGSRRGKSRTSKGCFCPSEKSRSCSSSTMLNARRQTSSLCLGWRIELESVRLLVRQACLGADHRSCQRHSGDFHISGLLL